MIYRMWGSAMASDGSFKIGDIEVERFHGQLKQDRLVLELLDFKLDGYFVEVGAWHPTNISNTFILESKFGWQGLCIDPYPVEGFAERRPGSTLIRSDWQKRRRRTGVQEGRMGGWS